MNIDVHNHAMPQRAIDLVLREPIYNVSIVDGIWHGPNIDPFRVHDAWASPDAKLRELDEHELDAAVVSIAPKPLYFYELPEEPQLLLARESNLGFAEYCAVHPDRLRWMAHVPLAFPETAANVLIEATEAGASGVEIAATAGGHRIDDPMFDPFWEAVDSLELPVFLHPAYELELPDFADPILHATFPLTLETGLEIARLIFDGHFDRYKNLVLIAAHGGGTFPYLAGRLANYIRVRGRDDLPADPWSYVGRVKFDALLHDVHALRFLIAKAGPENIMIGTDCAFSSAPLAPVSEVREATGTDDHAFRQITNDNAASLFGFTFS